ncbi:RNA polymerase sigma factor [Vitreimonas flagellata]|uniref:RNA polymerase sigma factor n=1 Tax=Vitreimonas flagellata TaxID=2560861 RepID=UPI001EF88C1B|nr:RNA polymerase sigma factor [Vitreimonas flagellata]
MAAVLAGDQRAFTQLMRRHKDSLYRFVRGYVGDASEAYDLVQESFVAAWHALARYDRQRSFGIWLKRIAINKCRDWRRRRAVRAFFYDAEDIDRPGLDIAQPIAAAKEREDELARLDDAIAALPANLKEPLLLSLMGEMSHRDIAEALGMTAKAVEVRIYRAKRALAGALATR